MNKDEVKKIMKEGYKELSIEKLFKLKTDLRNFIGDISIEIDKLSEDPKYLKGKNLNYLLNLCEFKTKVTMFCCDVENYWYKKKLNIPTDTNLKYHSGVKTTNVKLGYNGMKYVPEK